MDLRKRKHTRSSSDGLQEPLLAPSQSEDAEEALANSYDNSTNSERAIVPHSINKYDWEELWRSLVAGCVQSCANAWNAVVSCLSSILPLKVSPAPVELTPEQAEQLNSLQSSIAVQYEPSDEQHQKLLRQLWSHAFPGEPSQLQSEKWKDMGWQGINPATDFRGGGLISLQNLLFMANQKPELFAMLMHKTKGKRAQDTPLEDGGRGGEYPFAAAGVNFSHMLIEMLDLRDPAKVPASPAGQGFLELLKLDPDAFDEVYCLGFERFDELWLQTGVESGGKWGYFDFNSIKSKLQQELTKQLSIRPRTIAELRSLMDFSF